ncbi:unnamed protein product [Durusdinium trenchii]|uniref:Origin recognition complex subunit 3 N-terminal domain-containing protein n=1 Tax=Durusdinium trenchii TaxID=1381693 RepID=A0ABP0NJD3_9DINO
MADIERNSPYRFHFVKKQAAALPLCVRAFDHLGWKCSPAQSLCLDGPAGSVCKYWAQKVCSVAEEHVRSAFGRFEELVSMTWSTGSVPLLLALAGSDSEDHDATMHLVEALLHEKLPTVSTALIHPADLRNLSHANRMIMEKLSREKLPANESVDEDEDETMEDLASFSLLKREDGRGGIGLTVLLFQGVDAAPKDVLRHVLSFWHASCTENGMPLLIVFGLKQLPPNRQSLFDLEEDEQLPFIHVDTVQLFDSAQVCDKIIDGLIEDCSCPLSMCPQILKRLREIYRFQQQSVSHVLRALLLLFDEALSHSKIARLCEPLGRPGQALGEFHARVEAIASGGVPQQLQKLWHGEVAPTAGVAEAAAKAMTWRWKLVSSLPLFEVLMVGAWSTVKYQVKLSKIYHLLEAIWPVPASEEEKQREMLHRVFSHLQETLHCVPVEQLQRLLLELVPVASCLPAALRDELQGLVKQAEGFGESHARAKKGTDLRLALDQLRGAFRQWVDHARAEFWRPLDGAARDLFLAPGSLNCHKNCLTAVEKRLTSKFEGKLQYLAAEGLGMEESIQDAGQPLADAALVFQLLESSSGRQIKVAELWLSFAQLVSPFNAAEVTALKTRNPAEKEKEKDLQGLKHRFQRALMTLHHLGLFAPAAGGAQKGLSGWRLRKRVFGRVWLRDNRPGCKEEERAPKLPDPATPPKASPAPKEELATPSPPTREKPTSEPLAPGNKFLKRLPFGRRYDSPSRNEEMRREKKRRSERVYYG